MEQAEPEITKLLCIEMVFFLSKSDLFLSGYSELNKNLKKI